MPSIQEVSVMVWWMRTIGALYLLLFVIAVFLRIPIKAEGPKGLLARAAAGDPTARFVVDVWFMLGLYFAVIGLALLVGSRDPAQGRALVWTVIGFELAGIVVDVYKLARGYDRRAPVTWMFIHTAIIVSGVLVLR
jgi:hypothetical protein